MTAIGFFAFQSCSSFLRVGEKKDWELDFLPPLCRGITSFSAAIFACSLNKTLGCILPRKFRCPFQSPFLLLLEVRVPVCREGCYNFLLKSHLEGDKASLGSCPLLITRSSSDSGARETPCSPFSLLPLPPSFPVLISSHMHFHLHLDSLTLILLSLLLTSDLDSICIC